MSVAQVPVDIGLEATPRFAVGLVVRCFNILQQRRDDKAVLDREDRRQRSVGSSNLDGFLETNRDKVRCDVAVISDTAVGRQQKPARPNILLIQADDLGYGDLSAYGQTRFQTPSLDRLAKRGIRFTQYYSGSTVCAPSRSSQMSSVAPSAK